MFKDYQKSKQELENEVIRQGAKLYQPGDYAEKKLSRTQSRQVEMIEEPASNFEVLENGSGHRRSQSFLGQDNFKSKQALSKSFLEA